MRLQDKVAVITGAGSGIGRETALLFVQEGAAVVTADLVDTAGEKTVADIRAQGGRATYVHADVSRAADCEHMVQVAEQTYGKLNILFNNAGIMHSADDNAMATDEAVWDLTMAINLKGVFFGCKYGIPALQRAGGVRSSTQPRSSLSSALPHRRLPTPLARGASLR
jgi:NAD(P)-dependent dehydrogenase (short-subunit alcohol dehydrogenase family)